MGVQAVDMKEKSLLHIVVRAKYTNLIHVLLPLTPSLPQPHFKSNSVGRVEFMIVSFA
jgi:hypothetical protein